MKKQPAGTYRRARGKERPPTTYCIKLRGGEPSAQDVLLGISQRLPKGRWRMWPAALLGDEPDVFEAPEPGPADTMGLTGFADFGNHTAGVDWLVSVRQGLAKVSEPATATETEHVQVEASPESVAPHSTAPEFPAGPQDDEAAQGGGPHYTDGIPFREPVAQGEPDDPWSYPAPEGTVPAVADDQDMS